jgi:hypothetical protein
MALFHSALMLLACSELCQQHSELSQTPASTTGPALSESLSGLASGCECPPSWRQRQRCQWLVCEPSVSSVMQPRGRSRVRVSAEVDASVTRARSTGT